MDKNNIELFKQAISEGLAGRLDKVVNGYTQEIACSQQHSIAMKKIVYEKTDLQKVLSPKMKKIIAILVAAALLLTGCGIIFRNEIREVIEEISEFFITLTYTDSNSNGKLIEKVYESEYVKGECLQVSVYMDFFNVHVNFWPVDGEVTYYKYHPGKYMFAYLPKASELNEHTSVGMQSPYGFVFFKQIAGTFARRIVCHAKPGTEVAKADECGIIKFGSRIDMFFPLDTEIKVKIGDYVRACETVIAELHK